MTQRTTLALVGLTIVISQGAHAGHSRPQPKPAPAHITLSKQDKQHLFYDTFTLARTVRQIPEPVRERLLATPTVTSRDMADFGQPFDATDVVMGSRAPVFYRLIFSATSQGYCLVYYEHGGIAHTHKVDFFRLSGGRASRLWGADLAGRPALAWPTDPTTLAQLRAEIRHGRYDTVHRF